MLLRTMISMESESTFSNVAPRGSLQRFGLAGAFNSLIFILWELFRFFSSNDKASIQFAWGGLGPSIVLGTFVHRWFTFDKRKSVQWTIGFPTIAYAFSLQVQHIRLVWLPLKTGNFTNAWNSEHACMGRYYLGYPAYSCLFITKLKIKLHESRATRC